MQIDAKVDFIDKVLYNKNTKQYLINSGDESLILEERPFPKEMNRILWIGNPKFYIEIIDTRSPLRLMTYPETEMIYLQTILENINKLRGMQQVGQKVYNKSITQYIKLHGINSKKNKITFYANYSFLNLPLVITDRCIFFKRAYYTFNNKAVEFSLEFKLTKEAKMEENMLAYVETLEYDMEDNIVWPIGNSRIEVKPEEVVEKVIEEIKKKGE